MCVGMDRECNGLARRTIVAGLLMVQGCCGEVAVVQDTEAAATSNGDKAAVAVEAPAKAELVAEVGSPAKRSPISASGVYGAAPAQQQYIVRHGDDAQEVGFGEQRLLGVRMLAENRTLFVRNGSIISCEGNSSSEVILMFSNGKVMLGGYHLGYFQTAGCVRKFVNEP